MPVLCKQVKECLRWWMLRDEGFVEGHAKTRSVRQREAAICGINLHHARDGLLYPGIGKVVEMLLNFEIGCTRRNMKSCSGPDGPTHVVGCYKHVIGICPGGKLLGRHHPAVMSDICLHNICSLEFEQFTILMWRMQTLAGGNRNAERSNRLCDFLQGAQILRRHGLLNPAWAERCERISHRDRG